MELYLIRNENNGKQYVGKTIREARVRWTEHVSDALRKASNSHLENAIRKHGREAFTLHVLCQPASYDSLNKLERILIMGLRSDNPQRGYNLTQGGELGFTGCRHTAATRAKMSRPAWNKGKLMTTEQRVKLSAAMKGRIAWNKGKKLGPDPAQSIFARSRTDLVRDSKGRFMGVCHR